MGFLDEAKDKLDATPSTSTATRSRDGIDKAADAADKKTGGQARRQDRHAAAEQGQGRASTSCDGKDDDLAVTAPDESDAIDRFVVVPASYVFLLRDGDAGHGGAAAAAAEHRLHGRPLGRGRGRARREGRDGVRRRAPRGRSRRSASTTSTWSS